MSAPEPGVYPNVPMAEYMAWGAISNSGIGQLLRSPAHYRAYVAEPSVDTDALRFGRAVHKAVLEPDDFHAEFYQVPWADPAIYRNKDGSESANPANTKAYKDAVAAAADAAPGLTGLTRDEWDAAWAMRKSALLHPRLAKVIQSTGQAELSIVWRDEATGVLCKSRLDWHTPTYAGGAILDLKTTPDASPWAFGGSANKFGYYRQGAMNLRGSRAVGLPAAHFVLAALEKEARVWTPDGLVHGCVLYRLREEDIQTGTEQINMALALYAECKRTGHWPAYTTDVVDLTLPGWTGRDIERNAEELVA